MTSLERIISVCILAALLVLGLVGVQAAPTATPNMQSVFLNNGVQSTSTVPNAVDALFTSLAQNATSNIDITVYDFNRESVRDALLAAKVRGVNVVGDNEIAESSVDGASFP